MSISTIGTHEELSDADLEAAVRREAGEWIGAADVAGWRHLRTYRIPFAQPNQVSRQKACATDQSKSQVPGQAQSVKSWCGERELAVLGGAPLAKNLSKCAAPADRCSLKAPSSLPRMQAPPTDLFRPVTLGSGLYVCGDHRCAATLDGALKSGRLAAEAVVSGLKQQQRQPAVAAAAAAGR